MSNKVTKPRHILKDERVQQKIEEIFGDVKKTKAFLTSALSVINANSILKSADETSIYQAVMTAATLNLPINPNLGYAYLVPYKGAAQFQIGYKGFIQLCWRSGQFKTIAATEIYEGQLVSENTLTGFVFDFGAKKSEKVIGYAAYFELINGGNKTLYMSKSKAEIHAKKYSQTYKNGKGVWVSDFDEMAKKTVLKLLLNKYAPMSVEMQQGVTVDQAVINDYENMEVDYIDNKGVETAEIIIEELTPEHSNFDTIKKAIAGGTYKISDVKAKYSISPEVEALLIEGVENE